MTSFCCLCGKGVSPEEHQEVVDIQRMDELWFWWMCKQLDSSIQAQETVDLCTQLIFCIGCWLPTDADWRDNRHEKIFDPITALKGL